MCQECEDEHSWFDHLHEMLPSIHVRLEWVHTQTDINQLSSGRRTLQLFVLALAQACQELQG